MRLQSKQSEERYSSTTRVSNEPRVVVLPNVLDFVASDFLSLIDFNSSDVCCSSRIGSRGIGSFNFKGTALNSAKVSGMNSSMLRARGSNSSPAAYWTVFRGERKDEFGLNIDHIIPIKNDCGEGIFDSDPEVGKENAWSLNAGVNREAQENHDCCEGNVCPCGVIAISERGVEHSGTENVTKHRVNERASRAKDLRVTTTLMESSIGVIAHE